MKNYIITLSVLCALATLSNAAVLTVSNAAVGGAQYTSLAAAVSAASNGDTLLMENTNISYTSTGSPFTLNKNLVVIGIGFNANINDSRRTIIDVYRNFNFQSGSSGSQFHGIYFKDRVVINAATNLLFANCLFEDNYYSVDVLINANSSSIAFQNCLFEGQNLRNVDIAGAGVTAFFSSCVFNGWIDGSGYTVNTITLDHCLFLGNSGASLGNFDNASISNSIFMNETPATTSSTGNTFLNNIERVSATLDLADGNQHNTDPQFVTYTFNSFWNPNDDYDLQVGSPGIGAGTFGADIGPHGSSTSFSETFETLIIPIVTRVTLQSATAAPGSTINVNVQARTPSTD